MALIRPGGREDLSTGPVMMDMDIGGPGRGMVVDRQKDSRVTNFFHKMKNV